MADQTHMIDAGILKPILTLIDEKVTLQEEREKVKNGIIEIIDAPKGLVCIDANDVRDLFQEGGVIHAFNASVDASKENRMAMMMAMIMRNAKHFESYNHALVFFFFPEDRPLLIEELQSFSDWIESVSGDLMIKWGMATQSTQELRAIILLQ